ncbi:MAG: transketolase [Methanomassiliicoccales archaeon]|nr:transketolase [Methanomassiliicoccales archaeon]
MANYSDEDIDLLKQKANLIRRHVLRMTFAAGSGHPGGSLSCADILAALYFKVMNHRPQDPKWEDRDRLVLSKGHAAPAYYAALAESGYFPVEELVTLRKLGSRLQGHPSRSKTPGVEMSTGSLGQGLSVANGMALAARLDDKSYRVFCLCGDGEMQSGQIWEAAMLGAHYKLDNVTAFLDRNMLQIDGPTEMVMSIEPIAEKWDAFGWNVVEIDGHDLRQILDACDRAKETKGRPTMVIAHTIKGKNVSYMENSVQFHGKAPNKDELNRGLKELGGQE